MQAISGKRVFVNVDSQWKLWSYSSCYGYIERCV